MSGIKLTIDKKIEVQASEITFVDAQTLIASSTGQAQVWKNDAPEKTAHLPGHIDGKFTYSENKLSSGIVSYDFQSARSEYNTRYTEAIVAAYAPEALGMEDQFEASYVWPLPDQDRLIVALHYRPTRRPGRTDPSPLPNDVIALLKLSDASLVSVLDTGMFLVKEPVIKDHKLYFGCDKLKCWDLSTGKHEATFDFFRLYTYTAYDSGVLVFLENGEVWSAESSGKTTKLATLPVTVKCAVYIPEHKSIVAGDNKTGLHVIAVKNSKLEITNTLELEREADGIFLHPDHKHVYVPVYLMNYVLKVRVG